MLSSKNRQEYKQKYGDKKQRYSIHRVGLVTASVLVGLVFSGMNGKAHADTIATTTTVHENNTTDVVATNDLQEDTVKLHSTVTAPTAKTEPVEENTTVETAQENNSDQLAKQDTTLETGVEPVQPEADKHDQKQFAVAKDTNTKTTPPTVWIETESIPRTLLRLTILLTIHRLMCKNMGQFYTQMKLRRT